MMWFIAFVVGLIGGSGVTIGVLLDRARKVTAREQSTNALRTSVEAKEALFQRRETQIGRQEQELQARVDQFDARVIKYDELRHESALLKRDLQNIDVNLHKSRMDNELLHQQQQVLDQRSHDLASRYLAETVKSVASSLNLNNYAPSKDRLMKVIDRCRGIGFNITAEQEQQHLAELKADYEEVVRIAVQREEQAKIKAQIREEERIQREAQRAIELAQRDRELVQATLDRALADARGVHNEEVERLKAQLAEAQAQSERAISMAQQTKAGNVYVISNQGSFGENVFKIGMTRRLEPLDRVKELGDASVPFPFDVHMMIACNDAPSLENALHKALHRSRLNKVNPRKEFFRADLQTILDVVRKNHAAEVTYVAAPEAFEYRESVTMSDEDAEFIEEAFEAAEGQVAGVVED